MDDARQQLLSLIARRSFKLGQFKLSAGGTTDYYVDCRLTTLYAQGARATGRVVLDEIRRQGWNPASIGGMTLGADPIVVAVAMTSAEEARQGGSNPIDAFLVRKTEKAHGTTQRLEGCRQRGDRVVIVDDVCTTGASTIAAIEAARADGLEIVGVLCLVEREDAAGRPAVEKAASPAPFVSLFKASEVRREHLRQLGSAPKA